MKIILSKILYVLNKQEINFQVYINNYINLYKKNLIDIMVNN